MRHINRIVIHNGASNLMGHHLKYHYIITKEGEVEDGIDLRYEGKFCVREGTDSIGIFVNNDNDLSPEQVAVIRRVCNVMCGSFNIDKENIYADNGLDISKILGE